MKPPSDKLKRVIRKDPRARSLLSAFVLLTTGAFGIYELRSLATFQGHVGSAPDSAVRDLLSTAAPLLSLLIAAGLLLLVFASISFSFRNRSPELDTRRLALVGVAAVTHVYGCQELLQIAIGDGHALGLHGLFGHGGWVMVPLVLVLMTTSIALVRALRSLEGEHPLPAFTRVVRCDGTSFDLLDFRTVEPGDFISPCRFGRGPPSFVS